MGKNSIDKSNTNIYTLNSNKTYHLEWDENKEKINVKKHGLNFETASMIFYDPFRIEIYDDVHSTDEDRYITIGCYNSVLMVVYTVRENRIRIISARKANIKERIVYFNGEKKNS